MQGNVLHSDVTDKQIYLHIVMFYVCETIDRVWIGESIY
jgi:hypothetical protein